MKHNEILKALSLDEKVKWTAGNNMWTMIGSERLGIKSILVADGPHGVRVYKKRLHNEHLEQTHLLPSTMFPSAAAMAATFNEKLIYEIGETIGKECNMYGVDILLAPGVNLKRSPLAGRNFEYYSEDPLVNGKMATNFINGVQSQGIGTCIKHFALNEQENQRRWINTIADERTMHEIYLKPFKMAIKDANPWCVMSSYNRVNGHYAAESEYLLKDVLRKQWNYDGTVMSDWGGVQHKVKSIKNGLNIEMPGTSEFNDEVYQALNNKQLTEQEIDESLRPLLVLRDKVLDNKNKGQKTDLNQNHLIAAKIAEEAIILLENDGILPLNKGLKLGVVGDFAVTPRINGGGSATLKPFILENPLEELKKSFEVTYAQGYIEENTDDNLLSEVTSVSKSNDIVLFFTGTTEKLETEGKEREHMNLPKGHIEVFSEIKKHAKRIIVILNNGSAVDVEPIIEDSNAIVESWFLGGANAKALVKVLTGEVNPSGRLSETFPLRIENTPHYGFFPNKEDEVNYCGDIINLGYRYYDTHKLLVRYPFGYGLSYTTFSYSKLVLDKETVTDNDTLTVNVDITNTGKVEGKEVVQLYVRDIESYYPRPYKELEAFKKVSLKPGETKTVKFELNKDAFSIYSSDFKDFRVESGEFEIMIGKNVNEIKLCEKVNYQSNQPLRNNLTLEHPLKNFFIYKPEKANKIAEKYREFPWYEIEEPTLRVLKRVKRDFNISDEDFEDLLNDLLE